jgi:hypothetical protein
MAMIIETGCWGCDGPPTGIVRAWKAPDGQIRIERILGYEPNSPNVVDIDGNRLAAGAIRSISSTQDGSVMAVSICIQGTCALDGLDAFDPNSITAIFRSTDGGVTWQEVVRRGPVAGTAGVMTDGQLLVGNSLDAQGLSTEYSLFPGDTPITPPTGAVHPVVAGDAILWATADERLIRTDGSDFLQLPPDPNSQYPAAWVVGNIADPDKGSAIVHGYDSHSQQYLRKVDGHGATAQSFTIDGIAYVSTWFPKDSRVVLSITPQPGGGGPPVPAFLDVDTGVFNLIREPFQDRDSQTGTGRTIVHAVQIGPFARVTGTGSCLNIRTDPSVSAEVLTCMADGVLLRESSDVSAGWVSVMTPGGTQGWASAAFLER